MYDRILKSKSSKNGKPVYAGRNGKKVFIPEVIPYLVSTAICMPFLICIHWSRKVRGLPRDAVPLIEMEKQQLLETFQGHWKIQELSGERNRWAPGFTDVYVNGDKMIFSGGMYNRGQYGAAINENMEQRIIPFQGGDGRIYIDNIGTILVREQADNSEIELDSALDSKLKFVRKWKMEGKVAPNHQNNMIGGNASNLSTADEISKLQKLRQDGALSEEEFRVAKMKVLSRM